ncbi:MAG: hypothetical protein EBT21_02450 [Actinobacteria bacterium]|nr:hypothetical protein [Actinomycetota bacterium]
MAPLAELFASEPSRTQAMSIELNVDGQSILIDASKQNVDKEVFCELAGLAMRAAVADARDAMLSGAVVNTSEVQPALHTALRAPRGSRVDVNGVNVVDEVWSVRDRVSALAHDVREGRRVGATGKRITDVVNIGIGGSDLGPALVYSALSTTRDPQVRVSFVSNVDPTNVTHVLAALDPASTLVVVCSKSFSTAETLANARIAQRIDGVVDVVLGRRSLLGVVGGQRLQCDRVRRGCNRPIPRRDASDGRALCNRAVRAQCADGARADRCVEPQLPRSWLARDGSVLRRTQPVSCVPPTAGDGEQWQVGVARWRGDLDRDRASDLGRCWHECPTRVHATDPPGNVDRARHVHRRCTTDHCTSRRTHRARCQHDRPVGGARIWSVARGSRTGNGGEPTKHDHPVECTHPDHPRSADCALRTRGVRPGVRVGHQLFRPMGCRTGQEIGTRSSCRTRLGFARRVTRCFEYPVAEVVFAAHFARLVCRA